MMFLVGLAGLVGSALGATVTMPSCTADAPNARCIYNHQNPKNTHQKTSRDDYSWDEMVSKCTGMDPISHKTIANSAYDFTFSLLECCKSCLDAVEKYPTNGGSTPWPLGEKRKQVSWTVTCSDHVNEMNLPSDTCARLHSPQGIPWLIYAGAWHQNVHCNDIATAYAADPMAMGVYYRACEKTCTEICESKNGKK